MKPEFYRSRSAASISRSSSAGQRAANGFSQLSF
jgi:hypothetical protein